MRPRESSGIFQHSSDAVQRSIGDAGTEHELLDQGIRVLAKVCEISYGFLFGRNLRTGENLALRTFRSKTQPSFYNCKIFSRACWLSFIDKKWNL